MQHHDTLPSRHYSCRNAVISGRKKWLLYPPHIEPPGVHSSVDGADVATSVSLTEWFLNHYQESQELKVGTAALLLLALARLCICSAGYTAHSYVVKLSLGIVMID